MKAWVLRNAVGIENLKFEDRDVPKPGPHEVVLKMKAASLNYRDLMNVTAGRYKLPYVPLSDGCGFVEAVGPGVTRVKVGDRVAPSFFQKWISGPVDPAGQASSLGGPADGCMQEYMCLSEEGVSKVPGYLTDAEVATLPCAGLTAWRSLIVEGGIKPGETVVVQGTGGVSIFALQFAKAAGATVIATSSSEEKLDRVKTLGADHVINYKATPDWGMEVRKLTGGRGADHIVEVGGAGTFNQSLTAVKTGGHVSVIGVLAGYNQEIPIALIMGGNIKIKGVTVGSRLMVEQMCAAMDANKIRPVISDTLPLSEAPKALELMKNQGHFGKICLAIG